MIKLLHSDTKLIPVTSAKSQEVQLRIGHSDNIYKIYSKHNMLAEKYEVKSGIMTGNDAKFLRLWYEVNNQKVSYQ